MGLFATDLECSIKQSDSVGDEGPTEAVLLAPQVSESFTEGAA